MDPSTLAVVGTNSMIEPITRVIDSAVPTSYNQEPTSAPSAHFASDLHAANVEKFAKPYPTDVSAENPLLGLTPQEYLALKRYQREKDLPVRFQAISTAASNAFYHPREPQPCDGTFRTSYQEYGKYQPNKHTMPYSYHGMNTKFSQKKFNQGMYKNNSFNL